MSFLTTMRVWNFFCKIMFIRFFYDTINIIRRGKRWNARRCNFYRGHIWCQLSMAGRYAAFRWRLSVNYADTGTRRRISKWIDVFQIDRILIEKIKIACRQKFICRQAIFLFPVSNIKVEFYHISESIFIFIVYRYIQHKWHRGSTSGSPPFYRVPFWSMP